MQTPANKGRDPNADVCIDSEADANRLLSRDDVEREYGISRRWLELAAMSGNTPPMIRVSRRMVRYRRADLEAWLRERTVRSTSQ